MKRGAVLSEGGRERASKERERERERGRECLNKW